MTNNKFLYKKLYDSLKTDITNGIFAAGQRLPVEDELAQQFGVSVITVKKALRLLVDEGLVQRVPGKGSFVTGENTDIEEKTVVSSNSEKLIGLILEHVSTPYGLEMMYKIDEAATARGYKLITRFSYGHREKENEEIEFLLRLGVSGMIIMPSHGAYYNTTILKLIVEKFPVVLIDKALKGIPVASVNTDNELATRILVEHLVNHGCKRIGFITPSDNGTTSLVERKKGFYDSISHFGLEPLSECIFSRTNYRNIAPNLEISNCVVDYLSNNLKNLDGIVCAEFGIMPEFCIAAEQLNVKIPQDIKVCCIDEDYMAPGGYFFTHVKQDETAIGEKALSVLADTLEGGEYKATAFKISPIFNQGQST